MPPSVRMLLGCLAPLLLIFWLPLLGVSSDVTYFVFFVLMFGCHLFMMSGHGHGQGGRPSGKERPHDSAQS